MIKTLVVIWNNLFAPRSWEPFGDSREHRWRMRRWRNGAWEVRECTEAEHEDARLDWAIR